MLINISLDDSHLGFSTSQCWFPPASLESTCNFQLGTSYFFSRLATPCHLDHQSPPSPSTFAESLFEVV